MKNFFRLKEKNTDIKTEFFSGLIIFCSMCYILMVNANLFTNPLGDGTNPLGVSYGAIYIATAVSAIAGCFTMGLIANLPLALASGMGLNAFFVYTICITLGFSYTNALAIVFIAGFIFLILTLTGGLKKILESIPICVRSSISAGVGLFIAFLGLQNSGIIIIKPSTGFVLKSFNVLTNSWADIMPSVVTVIGLLLIAVLAQKKIKGAILWGILFSMFLYYLFGFTIPDFYTNLHFDILNPIMVIKQFNFYSFGKVFVSGFDFSEYIVKHGLINFILIFTTTVLSVCLINIFDSIGSLYAICEQNKLINKKDEIKSINKVMISNSLSVMSGSVCGTSVVTTYIESITGIAEGGRTGLTAVFTGIFFIIAIFLSPIARLVPVCATSAVLIYVGILMMSAVKNIDWNIPIFAVPAFMTIVMIPFTCNISIGIMSGLISYLVISVFTGNLKNIKLTTWIISLIFIITMCLTD